MIGLNTLEVKEAETQTKEDDEKDILAQSDNETTSMNNLEGSVQANL